MLENRLSDSRRKAERGEILEPIISGASIGIALIFLAAYFGQIHPKPPTLNGIVIIPLSAVSALLLLLWARKADLIFPSKGEVAFSLIFLLSVSVSTWLSWTDIDPVMIRPIILGLLCYISLRVIVKPINWKIFRWFFSLYSMFSGTLCILQVYYGPPFYLSEFYSVPPTSIYASGFSAHANYGAIFLCISLIFSISYISTESKSKKLYKYYYFFSIILGSAGLICTLSRAAVIAYILSALVLLFRAALTRHRARSAILVAFSFGAIVVQGLLLPETQKQYLEDKSSDLVVGGASENAENPWWTKIGSYSLNTRAFVLDRSLSLGEDALFGVGIGNFPKWYARHYERLDERLRVFLDPRADVTAHNGYLGLLVGSGVLALGSVVAFCLMVFAVGMTRPIEAPGFHAATALAAVGFWLLFHDGFEERIVWVVLGIAAGLVFPLRTTERGLPPAKAFA